MQRYQMVPIGHPQTKVAEMSPDPHGEWVRWEDVERQVNIAISQLNGITCPNREDVDKSS